MSAADCSFCNFLIGLNPGSRVSEARRDGEGRGPAFREWHHRHCDAGSGHGCNFPWLPVFNADTNEAGPSCYEQFDAQRSESP